MIETTSVSVSISGIKDCKNSDEIWEQLLAEAYYPDVTI